MASWGEIETDAPALTSLARELLDAHVHKTIATLRLDGSPRISGIEATIADGNLYMGSMPGSRKGADLARDPRFALHSGSEDPPGWSGDAKLSGRVEALAGEERDQAWRAMGVEEPSGESDVYRAEIGELVVTHLNEARDGLVIELWSAEGGLRSIKRK